LVFLIHLHVPLGKRIDPEELSRADTQYRWHFQREDAITATFGHECLRPLQNCCFDFGFSGLVLGFKQGFGANGGFA